MTQVRELEIEYKLNTMVLELAAEYHQAVRELLRKGVTEKLTWQYTKLKE